MAQFTTDRGNRDRWAAVVKDTHKYPFCPKHDRENRGRRARGDRHKGRRGVK